MNKTLKIFIILVLLLNNIYGMETSQEEELYQEDINISYLYDLLENHARSCLYFCKKINFNQNSYDTLESNFFYLNNYKISSKTKQLFSKENLNNDLKSTFLVIIEFCQNYKDRKDHTHLFLYEYVIAMYLNDLGYKIPDFLWQEIRSLKQDSLELKEIALINLADLCVKIISKFNIDILAIKDIENAIKNSFEKTYNNLFNEILTDKYFEFYNIDETIVEDIINFIDNKLNNKNWQKESLKQALLCENFFLDFNKILSEYRHKKLKLLIIEKINNNKDLINQIFKINSENIKKLEILLKELEKQAPGVLDTPKHVFLERAGLPKEVYSLHDYEIEDGTEKTVSRERAKTF